MRYVLRLISVSITDYYRACLSPEILLRAAPPLPQLGHIILLQNRSHEPSLWHSKQFSLIGTRPTKKPLKLVFGLRTTQGHSLVVPSYTSCRASSTKTDTMWDLLYLFPLANLREGKWCSLSSTPSCSACSSSVTILALYLSALQVFAGRLLYLFLKRYLPQGRPVCAFAADP